MFQGRRTQYVCTSFPEVETMLYNKGSTTTQHAVSYEFMIVTQWCVHQINTIQ